MYILPFFREAIDSFFVCFSMVTFGGRWNEKGGALGSEREMSDGALG